jgi:MFS-type transporter involved in bile tolerance (Atg22 family)
MPMKRKIITIAIGALILFIWNALSWMVLPFHSNTLNNIPETSIDSQLLQENLPKDGVYHYPGLPESQSTESMQAIEAKLKEGPRITLMVFKKGGTELFEAKTFAVSLLLNFLTVLVLLTIVNRMEDKSKKSVLFTTILIGLTIGLVSEFPQMNWYMFPLDYTIVNVTDHIISFFLVGLLFSFYTFKIDTKNE